MTVRAARRSRLLAKIAIGLGLTVGPLFVFLGLISGVFTPPGACGSECQAREAREAREQISGDTYIAVGGLGGIVLVVGGIWTLIKVPRPPRDPALPPARALPDR